MMQNSLEKTKLWYVNLLFQVNQFRIVILAKYKLFKKEEMNG